MTFYVMLTLTPGCHGNAFFPLSYQFDKSIIIFLKALAVSF